MKMQNEILKWTMLPISCFEVQQVASAHFKIGDICVRFT
jgi:hypothetical protein